jgi:hypothetical protein
VQPFGRSLRIEGHTDSRGIPSRNQKLSEERATAVARWLVEHGVAPSPASEPPRDGGVTIRRPLRDLAGPEARYVYELARRF